MRRRPSVIIVGSGFGGLSAAQALKSAPVDVTLIDRNNYHLFQPLLYQVATGSLSAGEIAAPLRSVLSRQKNTRVLRIGRLDPIHSEGTDSVDASQIHCVERLGNRERSCYAHSISFHAGQDRDGVGTLFISSRAVYGFFQCTEDGSPPESATVMPFLSS